MSVDILREMKENAKKDEKFMKIVYTMFCFYGHFSYGIINFIVGTSIIDMKEILQTDIESVSFYFTALPIGYIFGAFFGFLYTKLNRQLVIIGLHTIMAVSLATIPHISSLTMMYACGALIGLGMGAWDSAAVVWLAEIWKDKVAVYYQVNSLIYAIGVILSPLLVKPFITGEVKNENEDTNSTTTIVSLMEYEYGPYYNGNETISSDLSVTIDERRIKLTYPYTIGASAIGMGAMIGFCLYIYKKYTLIGTAQRVSVGSFMVEQKGGLPALITGWRGTAIVIIGIFFLGSSGGAEVPFMQFIPTYAHYSDLHLSESSSALLLTAVAITFAIGRAAASVLSIKISPNYMFIFNLSFLFIGNAFLMFSQKYEWCLWTGAAVYGLGLSSCSPTIYAILKQYIALTNIKGALFVSTIGGLMASVPLIVGPMMKTHSIYLIYISIVLNSVNLCAFIGIICVVYCGNKKVISSRKPSSVVVF